MATTTTAKRGRKPKQKVNLTFNQKDTVKLQVNSKTWVYVKPDITQKEIDEIKKRYAPKF
jgi:hypothetical protein